MPHANLILTAPLLLAVRRNHGLEHATLHVLGERIRPLRAAGHAELRGFRVVGDMSADAIRAAAEEAIRRMQAGETWWAVHPGCGTNVVASSLLTSAFACLGTLLAGRKAGWQDKLSNAISLGALGALIAHPLGPWLQARVMTSADMRGARVRAVRREYPFFLAGPFARTIVHFVETAYEG
ncbi:MAG: DUF6391 domain-containing protein [Thermoflexales bacterium]